MSDADLDELRSELDSFANPEKSEGSSTREQRIIAGFEEIERFVGEHDRVPEHGESRDIFERLYATRLERIRASAECLEVLKERDSLGLLKINEDFKSKALREEHGQYKVLGTEEPTDEELLSVLSADVGTSSGDITQLRHVRSREEIRAAEEVAQRNACHDFDRFRPIFEKAQIELDSGFRKAIKYKDNAEVKQGDMFILSGQKVYVADLGGSFVNDYGRPDRRLRVIYDNGTESDLLLRSLQRGLNKDEASRRIAEPGMGPLFSDEEEDDDLPTGTIYVLRSKSDHPFVEQNRIILHKIGVTGGDVKIRIASAKKDPTYLLAEVEIVATFKLSNINRKKFENLLHKFFGNARLDLELKDRFGGQVEPREWFLVPLPAIEEAIQRIKDGSIANYQYDSKTATIKE